MRLAGLLYPFWDLRGHYTEGRRWLTEALATKGDVAPAARVRAPVSESKPRIGYDLDQLQKMLGLERGVDDLDVLETDKGELDMLIALRARGDDLVEGGEHFGAQQRLEQRALASSLMRSSASTDSTARGQPLLR